MTVIALIGAKGLYLLFAWLLSAAAAAWLTDRKGYGERPGLATGLLLSAVGLLAWIVWPARSDSKWKLQGIFGQKAGTMSGGEQQMLAIGRAMMARPSLLLLDEPSMGIAPILVERIYETIAEINRQGTTILLVEQNANFALEVSNRAYVLETGTVAISDDADKLMDNPDVQKAYLGA